MHFCHSILVEENRPVSIHEEVSNVELVRLWPDTTQCAIQCCLDLLWQAQWVRLGLHQARPCSNRWHTKSCLARASKFDSTTDQIRVSVIPAPSNLYRRLRRLPSQRLRPVCCDVRSRSSSFEELEPLVCVTSQSAVIQPIVCITSQSAVVQLTWCHLVNHQRFFLGRMIYYCRWHQT